MNGEEDNHINFCVFVCFTIESGSNESMEFTFIQLILSTLIDSAIHLVEENHEDDNLSIGNGKDNNPE